MTIGTITAKGQTTIPKEIRDQLGLKAGDQVMFTLDAGRIIVRPRTGSVRDLENILPRPKRAASLKDMDDAIAAGAARRARR